MMVICSNRAVEEKVVGRSNTSVYQNERRGVFVTHSSGYGNDNCSSFLYWEVREGKCRYLSTSKMMDFNKILWHPSGADQSAMGAMMDFHKRLW
jgi:hypothetical protein